MLRRLLPRIPLLAVILAPEVATGHGLDQPRHTWELTPSTGTTALSTDYGLVVPREDGLELFADEIFAGRVYAYAIAGEPERWFAATSQGMFVSRDQGCSWTRDPAFSALATDLAVAGGELYGVNDDPGGSKTLMIWSAGRDSWSATPITSMHAIERLKKGGDDTLWMQVGPEVWKLEADGSITARVDELLGPSDDGVVLRSESSIEGVVVEVVERSGERWIRREESLVEAPNGETVDAWSLGRAGGEVWLGRSTESSRHHLTWSDGTAEYPFSAVYPNRCETAAGEATRAIWPTLQATGLGARADEDEPRETGEGCSCAVPRGPTRDASWAIVLVALLTRRIANSRRRRRFAAPS